jgi:hypothetical protein
LHNFQSEERLAVVRASIDAVFDLHDIVLLVEVCADPSWPPEARLLAAARLHAMHQLAAENREARPNIDLQYIAACTGSLDSQYWRSPWFYGSLLEPSRGPHEPGPTTRPVPLEDRR